MEHILEILLETVLDTLKLVPFLFLTYLFMEFLEHKAGANVEKAVVKAGRFGPALGALLGVIPQCGFSAAAAGLYSGRIITLGSLIAIFLSTSDEMLPIMISEQVPITDILMILGIKVLVALIAGMVIDFVIYLRKGKRSDEHLHIEDMCEKEHCHCEDGILKSAIHHTLHITLFVFIISLVLHLAIHFIGEDTLGSLFVSVPVVGNLIAGLVGLIPNCVASVAITQLYLSGIISLGSMISGLLVGAGVGVLVLFRTNRPLKDSFKVIVLLYSIGIIAGATVDLIKNLL